MLHCIVSCYMSSSYVTICYDGMGFGVIRHDMLSYITTPHLVCYVLYFYLVFSYILLSSPSHFLVLPPLYFFTTSPLFSSRFPISFTPPLYSYITYPPFFHHLSFLILITSHLTSPPLHSFSHHLSTLFSPSPLPHSHHLSSHFTTSPLFFSSLNRESISQAPLLSQH